MPEVFAWRIDKKKWASTSFTGAGAAIDGGRWNSSGVAVVYASANLAMAAQEKYVHLPKPIPRTSEFVKFRLTFDRDMVKQIAETVLPDGWRSAPPLATTQKIGDDWVRSAASAVLAVPSAIIPEEFNFLINPAHPDFKNIRISAPEPFEFDYRVARLVEPPSV